MTCPFHGIPFAFAHSRSRTLAHMAFAVMRAAGGPAAFVLDPTALQKLRETRRNIPVVLGSAADTISETASFGKTGPSFSVEISVAGRLLPRTSDSTT
eukprot:scaffold198447_cov18-Prasinocladus_malaysianus.AAC.1